MTSAARKASLFRNGRSQAIRIPKDFELPGTEALIRKERASLVIDAVEKRRTLLEVIDSLGPTGEEFPEIEDLPADPVENWLR